MRITKKDLAEMNGEVLVIPVKPVEKTPTNSQPKSKATWVFTLQRDDFGRLKSITAQEQ